MVILQVARIVTYPSEIDRILKKPGGPVGVKIRRMCLSIAALGEQTAKHELGHRSPYDAKRTGNYSRRFRVEVRTNSVYGFEYEVSNNAKYAAVLELGSRPHKITARKAKFLRFRDRQGQWRKVRTVFHPGQKLGYHILWRATQTIVREQLSP